MPVPICTVMQNFTPIGVTVAEKSVTVQKTYLKLNYQTKRLLVLRLSITKPANLVRCYTNVWRLKKAISVSKPSVCNALS